MEHASTEDTFPSDKRPAVERALEQTFGTTHWDSLTLLTGGFSGALVYRIVVGGRPYLLRIITAVSAFNDPARQYACMNAAAQGGIAPAVYYASPEDALSLTDFIDAKPRDEVFPSREALLKALVKTIQSIQALPPFPVLINYLDGVDHFIQEFHESGILPEAATQEHFRLFAKIQKAYPRHDPDLVPSHNDLNPNNILCADGRLWVIDWEIAFQNDRYVDLANVANTSVADDTQEEIYLRAYFGDALDDVKRARFFLMRQVCYMFYAMVLMKIAQLTRTPDTPLDIRMDGPRLRDIRGTLSGGGSALTPSEWQMLMGKAYLNETLHQMQTLRFTESIKIVTDDPAWADVSSPR